jgi:ubiquinone/menaquinone biosynthesis C-methylase UbiE
MSQEHFFHLAAAYVRGKLMREPIGASHESLFASPLEALSDAELRQVIRIGLEQGLRLHRFKRTMDLPRVHKVLGTLRGLQPASLLDIGSGRGAFLWPLLHHFPALPVTASDILTYRVDDMQAVRDGGIAQLTTVEADATALLFDDRSFDVVTMLEVLEHIPDSQRALAEICRVASRFVILSMSSKEDNNPEHIHLFSEQKIRVLLQAHGVMRVNVDYVPGHMIVVASVSMTR